MTQQATQNSAEASRQDASEAGPNAADSAQLPVALFCHGGVWATGEQLLSSALPTATALHASLE